MSELSLPVNAIRKSRYPFVYLLLAAWFTVTLVLGGNNFFVAPGGRPPLALLVASTTPVILFLLTVVSSPSVRAFALGADLKLVTAVQAWRLGGYSFLVLYAYGYLPGYFAWPAGVGDMLIGATAPLLLAQMTTPAFTKTKIFVAWHVLGILDLAVAVGMGALGSLLLGGDAGLFPTTIMSQMPLVLVPTFFVPLFVILHVFALMQARE